MSEHNKAIRMAQKLLQSRAQTFQPVEVGYHQYSEHPKKRAYEAAANELEALILDEEVS